MGYRDDAFFKLPGSESGISASNPSFLYPPNRLRFLDTQASIDNKSEGYELKRGYIRGLKLPSVAEDVNFTSKKCNFQFNPSRILQSVSMKQDMYLPILQDPAQFTQPVGSMINFNFDLLFDRSEEVYRGVVTSSGGNRGVYRPDTDLFSPEPSEDVYNIGVLADLQVLYSVIGQGFSKDLIDYQKARLQEGAKTQFIRDRATTSSTEEEIQALDDSFIDLLNNENVLNNLNTFTNDVNAGNAAFLIPFPVRVIFSSLFMVDGFVTGTTVDFLKFNTNMVPLQVKVNVNMQAVYIGFAKEKTLITEQLESVQIEIDRSIDETASASLELKEALNTTGKAFKFSLTGDRDWDLTDETNASDILSYTYDESSNFVQNVRGFKVGFSRIGEGFPEEESETTQEPVSPGSDAYIVVPTNYTDKILKLVRAGQVRIEYTWSVDIYGPYETENAASSALSNIRSLRNDKDKHRGSYSNTETATTDDQWGYSDIRGIRRQEHGAGSGRSAWNEDPNINKAPVRVRDDPLDLDLAEEYAKYYVVLLKVDAQASTTTSTTGGNAVYTAVEEGAYIRQGSGKILNATFQLDWK